MPHCASRQNWRRWQRWVKSGQLGVRVDLSALCQKRHNAVQQTVFVQSRRSAKTRFHPHDFHALGTGLSKEKLVRMETSAQYLKFAEACDRIAEKLAKTERHRMTLKEMAEIWRKLAQEVHTKDYSKVPL